MSQTRHVNGLSRSRFRTVVGVIAAMALAASACGADDDADSTADPVDDETEVEDDDETGDEADDSADDDGEEAAPGEPQEGGTLRIAYAQAMTNLDSMTQTRTPHSPKRAVFEQLYGLDASLDASPILAAGHSVSDDELTWTIELQEGVLFHDGTEMTSEDVVASYERFAEVGVKHFKVPTIESVTESGDYAIEIQLSERSPALLDNIAPLNGQWTIHPAWVIEEMEDFAELEPQHWIGTGPYQYESHEPEISYVLTKFDDYWGGPEGEPSIMAGERGAYVDRVEVLTIEDDATRVSALISGEIDIAASVAGDDVQQIIDADGVYHTNISPGLNTTWKMNASAGPLTNDDLRLAIRTGLDREELMRGFGPEEFWRTKCMYRVMEGASLFLDRCHTYPEDMERARELVEESGYDGEEIIMMVSAGRADEYPMAAPMEAYLRELGLNITVDTVDGATFGERRQDIETWDIKHSGGGSVGSMPASFIAARDDRAGNDWANLPEEEWDETFSMMLQTADDIDEQLVWVERWHDIFDEMNNELVIGEVFVISGAGDHVHGIDENDNTYGFLNVWLEQ